MDYASLPAKTDADLTREEFLKLTRTSKEGSPQVLAAFHALMASAEATGTATYQGHVFSAGERRRQTGRSFCVARSDAERLAGLLGLRVGGYPEKGEMLIRAEAGKILKVTPLNPAFAAAWDLVDAAARRGLKEVHLEGTRIRISMVSSGTRSAAAMHPDDIDAFAMASGLTHHLRRKWEPGWLSMKEVADRLDTHTGNEAFVAAWRGLSDAVELRGAPAAKDARIQACMMKKRHLVVPFLHEDSLNAFVKISGLDSALRPLPPKTPEWRGSVEFARENGFHYRNPAYRTLLERLVADVQAGRVPTIDGQPVLFDRRAARSARPFCFHVADRERVVSHLGIRPAEDRTERDLERRSVFAALGLCPAGGIASKWLWQRCIEKWAEDDVLLVDGRELRGGWRRSKTVRHWCLDAASLDGFVEAVASLEAAMLGDGLTRDAVAVALRASPFKDPEFTELWNELKAIAEAAAVDGRFGMLRGVPIRASMARTSITSKQVVFLDERDLPAFAGILGRTLPFLVGDPEAYVRRHEAARELDIEEDDSHFAFLWNEMRFRHGDGVADVGGREIACGYLPLAKTPFAVARADLATLADLHADLVAGGEIAVAEGEDIYADEASLNALLEIAGPAA